MPILKIHIGSICCRDRSGQCLLLKVEVILQGPTFFVIIADGDLMPPPFRLDNLSEVIYLSVGVF